MEDRQLELQACRRELEELKGRVRTLSARLDRLEGKPARDPNPAPVPAAAATTTPVPKTAPVREKNQPVAEKEQPNLEGLVGRNLFAVLASILVLLGVGVFISTIYEHIPEIVKIGAM